MQIHFSAPEDEDDYSRGKQDKSLLSWDRKKINVINLENLHVLFEWHGNCKCTITVLKNVPQSYLEDDVKCTK